MIITTKMQFLSNDWLSCNLSCHNNFVVNTRWFAGLPWGQLDYYRA